MKKLFFVSLAIWSLCLQAQTEVKSSIQSVTIALNGAQVFRKTTINYNKGVSKVLIDNVSPSIRGVGIQASSLGNYRIMDVKHVLKYPEPNKIEASVTPAHIQKEMDQLNDSIFHAKLIEENLSLKIETIKKQKDIINKNRLTTGAGKSDSLPILKDLVDYYQKKVFQLDDQLMEYTLKYRRQTQNLTKMNQRLSELNQFNKNTNQPKVAQKIVHQIEVTVFADKSGTGFLEVNYLVDHAGWYPAYDLRVDDTEKPLSFSYKAYVFQNTKEDWENIPLKLVTYDNRINNVKPELPIWSIDYMREIVYKQKMAKDYDKKIMSNMALSSSPKSIEKKEMLDNEIEVDFEGFHESQMHEANVAQAFSNLSFDITDPYTIKSDGKEVLIMVSDQTLEAKYKHYLVPKIDTKAYLMATIPNWESMNLLIGNANLYFAKSYLGTTYIDPSTLTDTLAIDLGVDQSIFCERKKTLDVEKCKIIGNSRTQTITIQIVVKNNKNGAVNISIEDQVPITKNEGIEISINDKGKGELNPETGKLTWDIQLKAQEKRILEFTYTLKYDKHKTVR